MRRVVGIAASGMSIIERWDGATTNPPAFGTCSAPITFTRHNSRDPVVRIQRTIR